MNDGACGMRDILNHDMANVYNNKYNEPAQFLAAALTSPTEINEFASRLDDKLHGNAQFGWWDREHALLTAHFRDAWCIPKLLCEGGSTVPHASLLAPVYHEEELDSPNRAHDYDRERLDPHLYVGRPHR